MKWAFLSINVGRLGRGAETLTDELAGALVRRGHDVTVYQGGAALPGRGYRVRRIAIPWSDQSAYRMGDRTLATRIARAVRVRASNAAFAAWNTAAAIATAADRPDVIVPMNAVYGQIALCRRVAALIGARTIYLGGNGAADESALDAVDFYVVPAAAYDAGARARAGRSRVAVIASGVDTNRFTPDGERAPELDALAHPRFLAVGALASVKRLDLAIRGVHALGRGSLTIIGDGYLGATLATLGATLLGDRFRLLTEMSHARMPAVYRSADALVFPSHGDERYGLVLLEAMACNRPVVATDDAVRREIVGDGGLVCDPTDSAALASALARAVGDDWGDRPRRRALALDWQAVAARYEALVAA